MGLNRFRLYQHCRVAPLHIQTILNRLSLTPVGAVELAELYGLQQMGGGERVAERTVGMSGRFQIGDGACDLQYAVVGAC